MKRAMFTISILLLGNALLGQGRVGVGTATPMAKLHVHQQGQLPEWVLKLSTMTDTLKFGIRAQGGMVLPAYPKTQRDSIGSPRDGETIWCTDCGADFGLGPTAAISQYNVSMGGWTTSLVVPESLLQDIANGLGPEPECTVSPPTVLRFANSTELQDYLDSVMQLGDTLDFVLAAKSTIHQIVPFGDPLFYTRGFLDSNYGLSVWDILDNSVFSETQTAICGGFAQILAHLLNTYGVEAYKANLGDISIEYSLGHMIVVAVVGNTLYSLWPMYDVEQTHPNGETMSLESSIRITLQSTSNEQILDSMEIVQGSLMGKFLALDSCPRHVFNTGCDDLFGGVYLPATPSLQGYVVWQHRTLECFLESNLSIYNAISIQHSSRFGSRYVLVDPRFFVPFAPLWVAKLLNAVPSPPGVGADSTFNIIQGMIQQYENP